jgi:AcrR family transcriptional regulator
MKTTSFPPSEPPFKPVEEPWLREGTALFALRGKAALKVEPLAAAVFVSKSSFYHHFADLDVFLHRLIEYHLFRCGEIAKKERRASSIDPELLDVLMEHRLDLLFHRQLRFQKHEPGFDAAVRASERITGAPFIDLSQIGR